MKNYCKKIYVKQQSFKKFSIIIINNLKNNQPNVLKN